MEEVGQLNQSQAVNVLIQAVRIAQGKGAFTLDDAEMVNKAIRVFVPAGDPVLNKEPTAEAPQAPQAAAPVAKAAVVEPVLQKVTEETAGN